METNSQILKELAANNRNVRFIVENYDVLVRAHRGKAILVMDEEVVKVFSNEVEAVIFIHKAMMQKADYAIKKCSGPVDSFIFVPNDR